MHRSAKCQFVRTPIGNQETLSPARTAEIAANSKSVQSTADATADATANAAIVSTADATADAAIVSTADATAGFQSDDADILLSASGFDERGIRWIQSSSVTYSLPSALPAPTGHVWPTQSRHSPAGSQSRSSSSSSPSSHHDADLQSVFEQLGSTAASSFALAFGLAIRKHGLDSFRNDVAHASVLHVSRESKYER